MPILEDNYNVVLQDNSERFSPSTSNAQSSEYGVIDQNAYLASAQSNLTVQDSTSMVSFTQAQLVAEHSFVRWPGLIAITPLTEEVVRNLEDGTLDLWALNFMAVPSEQGLDINGINLSSEDVFVGKL